MPGANHDLMRGMALFFLLDHSGKVMHRQTAALLGMEEDEVTDALKELGVCYAPVDEYLDQPSSHRNEQGQSVEYPPLYTELTPKSGRPLPRLTPSETQTLVNVLGIEGISADEEPAAKLLEAYGALDASGKPVALSGAQATTVDNADALRAVAQACELQGEVFEISYLKDGVEEKKTYRLYDAILSSKGGERYLNARLVENGEERRFRTDRIISAHLLEETVSPCDEAPTAQQEERLQTAQLLFSPDAPEVEWPGVRLRQGGRKPDGSCIKMIPWYGSEWLPQHLAASGGTIVPLAPKKLVEMTRDYVERLLEELGE